MTTMRRGLAGSLLALALLIVSVSAKIESLNIDRDGRRVFHIESFGYEMGGVFEMKIQDFMVWYDSSLDDPEAFPMAFVLQRSANDEGIRIEQAAQNDDKCFHEDRQDRIVREVSKAEWDSLNWVESISVPGYYHLYFSNCDKNALVSFSMDLTQYNVGYDGKTRNYLSAGETSLPMWFFFFSVAFGVALVAWVQHLIRYKEEVRNIHHLMTVVIVLKVLTILFESLEYHFIKTTGTSHGWNIVYYVFSFMKGMMMFTVIVLIGTGWSYLKPYLTERDKQIMLAVIVVQAMVNMSAVILDETAPGSKDFLTWRDVLHLLDMICCCFILLPIVWSIRHLKEAAEVDGKAARVMTRLKRFRKFYVLVVSYIYFTRIIVFLLGATLPFEWVWVAVVFREMAALIFYCYTGWLFRPVSNNPYLEVSQDEGPDSPTLRGQTARSNEGVEIGVL